MTEFLDTIAAAWLGLVFLVGVIVAALEMMRGNDRSSGGGRRRR